MSSNIIKKTKTEGDLYKGLEKLASVYALVILCVFPFVVHDKYFDILPTKYRFFSAVTVAVLIVTVLYLIAKGAVPRGIQAVKSGTWIRYFDLVDAGALAFAVLITISTLQSEFRFESFWGNEGRYTGLFTLLLYVFTYFFVSRFLRWKQWYLDAFLAGGILACLWGITDYFRMDIFHFKERIASSVDSFTSSFGNINTYTVYVAMVIAISAVLFVTTKQIWRSFCYYICFVIGMFAIIMGESDNAYLSLGILFALLPLYTFRTSMAIRRYVVLTATVFTVARCIEWINVRYADKVIGINSLFSFLSGHDKIMVMIAGTWAAAGILYLLKLAVKKDSEKLLLAIRVIWGMMLVFAAAVVLYMFYDANFAGNQDKYQSIAKYLVFNDNWGTNRGFAWRISWENFQNFPLIHKIFGFGPDTFGIITVFNNAQEMSEKYQVVFDNAHNEYLQFLLTIGIAGLASYLFLLGAGFVKMTRRGRTNPLVLAPMFAFLCYNTQAIVNLNVPITAPFMWLFMAMALSVCRRERPAQKETERDRKRAGDTDDVSRRNGQNREIIAEGTPQASWAEEADQKQELS